MRWFQITPVDSSINLNRSIRILATLESSEIIRCTDRRRERERLRWAGWRHWQQQQQLRPSFHGDATRTTTSAALNASRECPSPSASFPPSVCLSVCHCLCNSLSLSSAAAGGCKRLLRWRRSVCRGDKLICYHSDVLPPWKRRLYHAV